MNRIQRRTRSSIARKHVSTREPRRAIVVFTEGKRSEPDYLRGLQRLDQIKSKFAITIDDRQGTPHTLVQLAVVTAKNPGVDEVWCLFDVESPPEKMHPNIEKARKLAAKESIYLAISNPCFELWLILHHQEQTAHLDTDQAVRLRKSLDGSSGKEVNAQTYLPKRSAAARRAKSLDEKHLTDDTRFPSDNPSSGMYKFLVAIEDEVADK